MLGFFNSFKILISRIAVIGNCEQRRKVRKKKQREKVFFFDFYPFFFVIHSDFFERDDFVSFFISCHVDLAVSSLANLLQNLINIATAREKKRKKKKSDFFFCLKKRINFAEGRCKVCGEEASKQKIKTTFWIPIDQKTELELIDFEKKKNL